MTSFLNMVKVAIATTGTGPVTVGSASDGFLTPAQAGAIDATEYIWKLKRGLDWEIFSGAPSSSGTVIARTTVEMSFIDGTIGTDKMDLDGNATLTCICSAGVLDDLLSGAANLSDLANAGTARTNLGLGGAATLNVGTSAGTVAAGDDARLTATRREVLSAARTYYVRTDGSDSNTGLANTSGGAFLTIQKAIDTVATLDLSIYDVTIQVADGTYTGANAFKTLIGAGQCIIQGNSGTPANVLISTTSADAFGGTGWRGSYKIKDLKVTTTTSGNGINAVGKGAYVEFTNIDFGSVVEAHVRGDQGGTAKAVGNYSITGGGQRHWNASYQGLIYAPNFTITITGTPAFSSNFANATNATILCSGNTYSGSATGARYSSSVNGAIISGGGTLPGNSAGSTATGGQYT